MEKKEILRKLKPIIEGLETVTLNDSPFYIASQVGITLNELLNTVATDDDLKHSFDIYVARYKSKVLEWAYSNKQYSFVEKLLVESQIMSDDEVGNDLNLNFTIGDMSKFEDKKE